MLKLISDVSAVLNVDDFYICEKSNGLDELIFNMSIYDENYPHILEEAVIEYEQPYLIKAIDAGASTAKIKCQLNLDALKAEMKLGYSNNSATLQQTVDSVLPSGWLFVDNSGSTISRTIEGNYTPLEVIQQCVDTYGVVFRFDVSAKIVRAYTLSAFQPLGAFASRELNLTEINFKGKSTDFFTRLYAYGKDGLSFADINDGKPYVDYHGYTDKVICAYWKDERYTIKENLLAAAQAAVKTGGSPDRSYECTVYDLAATNPEMYSWQDFSLFSVVRLIDDIKDIALDYQVVEYWRYPYYPEKNLVTLSSTAPKIQTTVKNIKAEIENPNSSFRQNMQALIDNMAASIAGYDGGNMLITQNSDGKPNGIKIMDTEDEATAQKILWLNLNGITYSHNGANGPYDTVWSFEQNGFVADWIVAGTMLANVIKGGTLTLGGSGNGNGVCNVLNSAGKTVVTLSNEGCVINGGKLDLENVSQWFAGVRVSDINEATASVVPGGVWAYNAYNDYSAIEPGGVHAGAMSGTTPEDGYSPKVMLHSNGSIVSTYAYEHTDSGSPNVVVWSNGLFLRSASSSKRYKEEITEQIPDRLDPHKLYALPVKSYKYKPGYLMDGDIYEGKERIGLIVEDVVDIYPDAVNYDESGQAEMWNSQILLPAMLKLIQEQNERIKRLEEALKK